MSKKSEVRNYVGYRINALTANMRSSGAKAALANLRRGVGRVPGELPELWGSFLNEIPDDLLGINGKPSPAEWAIYLSLTLFALHQQGNSESVSIPKVSLGSAAARLMDHKTDEERECVLRRFGPVVTAKDMPSMSYHLRCLIQLIKAKGIKLDYRILAEDIYDFQSDETRNNVRLRWGQDFYYNEKGEE